MILEEKEFFEIEKTDLDRLEQNNVSSAHTPNEAATIDWEFEIKRQENILKHEKHLKVVQDQDSRVMTQNHAKLQALNSITRIFAADSSVIMAKVHIEFSKGDQDG